MKRTLQFCLATAFLFVCVGLLAFLHQFTVLEGNWTYLEWEQSSVVSADGTQRPFDPMAGEPALTEGDYFRFTLSLPQRSEMGSFLVFEITDAQTNIFLDGENIYAAASLAQENTANLGQVQLPLPAGDGEELIMEVRPLSAPIGLFPPLLRMTADPTDAKGNIAYGNYYSFPAGAMALALALIWGLFLFGILNHKADWRLLLLMLTSIGLTIHPITVGYGWYFLTEPWLSIFCWRGIPILSALALAVYLLLPRDKAFRKALLRLTIWSLSVLTGCWTVSAMRQGYLFRYLKDQWAALLQTGYYDGLLYWLTAWLMLACALLSIWDMVCSVIRVQTEARTLKLKNEMAMESYRILEEKMREGAAVRHEFAHHLTALNAMYEGRNFDGIGRLLTELKGQNRQTAQVQFTQHFAINAMLQIAAERAEKAGIRFEVSAMLPPKLSIPEENLCTLFMNLLDNALEAAGQAEEGNRFIHLRTYIRSGFLAVLCENGYNGCLSTDQNGRLRSTKPESEAHGFGLALMETIAQKYKSILDVSYTETVFTIQTALKLPTETEN